jgi:superfamily II DNA/RNA helicase
MGLSEELLKSVYAFGLSDPRPVQQQSMLPMINGKNVNVTGYAGSGKTLAYVIAVLQVIKAA